MTTCDSAVPMEAPRTPRPKPGSVTPSTRSVPPGKMRKALNTTSSRHITAMQMPGVFMLPAERSSPPQRLFSCMKGSDRTYTRK